MVREEIGREKKNVAVVERIKRGTGKVEGLRKVMVE